jgi:hypothetical protein
MSLTNRVANWSGDRAAFGIASSALIKGLRKVFDRAAVMIVGVELLHRVRKGQFNLGRLHVRGPNCARHLECRAFGITCAALRRRRSATPKLCTRAVLIARSAETGQRFNLDTWVEPVRVARRRRG